MPHTVWPRSAAPRVPVLAASHCWLQGLFRRHLKTQRQVCLSLCGVSGPWCAQGFVWALWVFLVGMGLDYKCNFAPPLLSCWGFSFALGRGVSFFGWIQHSPVDGCSAASCNFEVLAGEEKHTFFYSTILEQEQKVSSFPWKNSRNVFYLLPVYKQLAIFF